MVIDVHVHTFPEAIAERALEKLTAKTQQRLTPAGKGTLADLTAALERDGVDRAVVCPIATKPSQFEGILRESLAIASGERGEEARRRVIPFASVHPADERRFEHLRRIAEAGLKGVKLHPFYQDAVLDSPEMLEYLRCCRDLGLVVQCHCGFDVGFAFSPVSGPERVNRILREVPGLTFIAAHLGGMFQWGGVEEHLLGREVYLDTSVAQFSLHDEKALGILRRHPPQYLLFATDWPWLSFAEGVAFVREAGFSPADEAAVLGGNAARLLGV